MQTPSEAYNLRQAQAYDRTMKEARRRQYTPSNYSRDWVGTNSSAV